VNIESVESVAPPHPSSLKGSYTEDWLLSRGPYREIPRPSLRVPICTRQLAPAYLDRLLVSFRTLLCPESLFVSRHLERPLSESSRRAPLSNDLVIPSATVDVEGLPILPDADTERWPEIAADLLTGAWFAHIQHVAELLESSSRELEAGRFTASAVLCRAAVEMSTRLARGVQLLEESTTDQERASHLKWLVDGTGADGEGQSIVARVNALTSVAEEYLRDEIKNSDELSQIYKKLCDIAHPRRTNRDLYVGTREDEVFFAPIAPPYGHREPVRRAAMDILNGMAVASAGPLGLWGKFNALLSGLRERTASTSGIYTYGRAVEVDLANAYPEEDLTSSLAYPLHTMLWYTRFNDCPLPIAGPTRALHFADTWLNGRTWSASAADAPSLHAWRGVRISICAELLQVLVETLNKGECASAAAIARFLLEHLTALENAMVYEDPADQCKALRDGNGGTLRDDQLDNLLKAIGMSREDSDAVCVGLAGGTTIRTASNGLVHADFSARKIYWGRYGGESQHLLRLPGLPTFSQYANEKNIGNPWALSGSIVLMAEFVLLMRTIT
jgi:hypothetical protein